MKDDTPEEVIKHRLGLLQHRLQQQGFAHTRRMAGTVQRILVNDYAKKDPGLLQGRNENNRIVYFRSNNPALIGQFVDVLIEEAKPFTLHGRLVE